MMDTDKNTAEARKTRAKPVLSAVLLALGALLTLAGLLSLSRVRGTLQYCAVAPQAGEKGQTLIDLARSGREALAEDRDAYQGYASGGVRQSLTLSAGEASEAATLYAMGEGWLEVYPPALVKGRRISETEINNGERLIMLDDDLAFRLFGTLLPEDATVQLNGHAYRVAGTVRHAGSLLGGRGVGDVERYDCYAPLIAVARDEIALDTINLSAAPRGGGAVRLFESSARAWLDGGTLIDLSKERMRGEMLPRALLLVIGAFLLVRLFKAMTGLAGRWIAAFKRRLEGQYLIRLMPRLIALILAVAAGYGALIGLCWLLMSFSAQPPYVFTEYVPDRIVEWSSITKVFWNVTGASAGLVRVGSRELRRLQFYGGMVRLGCVAVLLGLALLPRRRKNHDGVKT